MGVVRWKAGNGQKSFVSKSGEDGLVVGFVFHGVAGSGSGLLTHVVVVLIPQPGLLLTLLEKLHAFGIDIFDILRAVVIANYHSHILQLDCIGFALPEFFLVYRPECIVEGSRFDVKLGGHAFVGFFLTGMAEIVVLFGGFVEWVFILIDGLLQAGLEVLCFGFGFVASGSVRILFASGFGEWFVFGEVVDLFETGHGSLDIAISGVCVFQELMVLLFEIEVAPSQILYIDIHTCIFLGVSYKQLGFSLSFALQIISTVIVGESWGIKPDHVGCNNTLVVRASSVVPLCEGLDVKGVNVFEYKCKCGAVIVGLAQLEGGEFQFADGEGQIEFDFGQESTVLPNTFFETGHESLDGSALLHNYVCTLAFISPYLYFSLTLYQLHLLLSPSPYSRNYCECCGLGIIYLSFRLKQANAYDKSSQIWDSVTVSPEVNFEQLCIQQFYDRMEFDNRTFLSLNTYLQTTSTYPSKLCLGSDNWIFQTTLRLLNYKCVQ